MTTSSFTVLTAVLVAGAGAAGAQIQSTGPSVTVAPAVVRAAAAGLDPNQVICKSRGEPGHLGGRRLCGTRAQWDQAARDGADELAKVQNASRFNANPVNGGMGHTMSGMGH